VWKGRRACIDSTDAGDGVEPGTDFSSPSLDFPEDEMMRISTRRSYQHFYVKSRSLARDMSACCHRAALRMPRVRTRRPGRAFVSFRDHDQPTSGEQPIEAVPGHWKGDLT